MATVERGYDPRDFTLFAYGGAAPVHAARYAAELGVRQVIVPLTASVHGAMGLIGSDVVIRIWKIRSSHRPRRFRPGQRELFLACRQGHRGPFVLLDLTSML
jgi:N-methylhydantoinase A